MLRAILALLFAILYLIIGIPVLGIEWIISKFNRKAADISQLRMVQWAFRVILFICGTKVTSRFEIASAATSTEEIWNGKGNSIYPPAQAELRRRGIGGTAYTDFSGKRARQVTGEDYKHYDYLLCADTANIRNTIRITGADTEGKIRLLLDYTDRPGCSIADPWYSGNFEDTYRDVDAGCEGFLAYLKEKGAI